MNKAIQLSNQTKSINLDIDGMTCAACAARIERILSKNSNVLDSSVSFPLKLATIDIIENSKTVLWNGPAGYFENPNFALGSYEIAKMIIKKNKDNSIYSVAGGGDTIAVLNQINAINDFNFVSTAGGAFLEYLEGKELPGIKALN